MNLTDGEEEIESMFNLYDIDLENEWNTYLSGYDPESYTRFKIDGKKEEVSLQNAFQSADSTHRLRIQLRRTECKNTDILRRRTSLLATPAHRMDGKWERERFLYRSHF